MLVYRLDEAHALGADIFPGDREAVLAAAIPSSSGLRTGREICLSNENHSELRFISACSGKTVFFSAPLELAYPKDDSRLLLLEKTMLFLDKSSRILRRKVNASSPRPLLDDVLRFECGLEPERRLARVSFVPSANQENKYELWILPKNLELAGINFQPNDRGSMMIVTVFLFLTFSTLALSMIFLSQVYLKLGGFRKNASLLEYSSENGIKGALVYLLDAAGRAGLPSFLSEERYAALFESTRNSGVAVIEEALQVRFPIQVCGESGQMTWTSRTECWLDRLIEAETCFSARFHLRIDSTGGLKNFVPQKSSSLDG